MVFYSYRYVTRVQECLGFKTFRLRPDYLTPMGVLQTLFNQPSRSYASTEAGTPPAVIVTPDVDNDSQERAARRSNYYSAAADPHLRKEWDRILQQDRHPRSRRHVSAGQLQVHANSGQRPVGQPLQPLNHHPNVLVNRTKEEGENEEFFTPFSSPQASPRTASLDLGNHSPVPMQSLDRVAEQQHEQKRPPSSTSSLHPSSASVASTSEDDYTNYSWSEGRSSEATSLTRASSHTSRHSKQRSESGANFTAAADWGNEIRWLVPPETSNPTPRRSHTISARSTTSFSSSQSNSSSRSSSDKTGSRSGRSKTEPVRPRPRRRMSEIQEEAEDDVSRSSQDEAQLAKQPLVTAFGVLAPQRRKSQSDRTRPRPRKGSLATHSESSSSSSTPTADLPVLVPHAEPTTYSSLVFPRAGYQPSKHPERLTNSVDIVQLGVGSTTMSTISVTKHAAEHLNRGRKFSFPTRLASPRSSMETPEHLIVGESSIVSLTSHTPTPSKVQTNQVLVQVWCVALEGLDVLLTREKSKNADGYGFVPGRGFCGRIVEIGHGISNLRKGDWVMGLLDVGKVRVYSMEPRSY
jgi:Alcohol dehydrogenase GroES-like domain